MCRNHSLCLYEHCLKASALPSTLSMWEEGKKAFSNMAGHRQVYCGRKVHILEFQFTIIFVGISTTNRALVKLAIYLEKVSSSSSHLPQIAGKRDRPNLIGGKNNASEVNGDCHRRRYIFSDDTDWYFRAKTWLYFPNFFPVLHSEFQENDQNLKSKQDNWTFSLRGIYLMKNLYQNFLFFAFLKRASFFHPNQTQTKDKSIYVVGNIGLKE